MVIGGGSGGVDIRFCTVIPRCEGCHRAGLSDEVALSGCKQDGSMRGEFFDGEEVVLKASVCHCRNGDVVVTLRRNLYGAVMCARDVFVTGCDSMEEVVEGCHVGAWSGNVDSWDS